jgi:hypothetical protein
MAASGFVGYTGSQGAQGPAGGFTGSKGDTGFTGSSGLATYRGYTGSVGAGYTGSASTVIGYSGSIGYTGSASTVIGYTGSKGDPNGYTGSKGDIGYSGSFNTAVTFTFTGSPTVPAAIFYNMLETTTVVASAIPSTVNFYISSQSIIFYNVAATANWILNVAHSSGTSLNSVLSVGQSISLNVLVLLGSTPYYNTSVQIDGITTGVTTYWLGNSGPPVSGHANSVDSYSYSIIKTSSAPTYSVFASQAQFK